MKEIVIKSLKTIKFHWKEQLYLTVLAEKASIFNFLVKKINEEIKGKIEQEVEIIALDLVGLNSIDVKGRAGVMGIQKEFTVHTFLHVNAKTNTLSLQVKEINVEGGFLVKKGFALIEHKIKEKIESTARVDVKKTLLELNPKFNIPGSQEKMELKIESFDLELLKLTPDNEDISLQIGLREGSFVIT